MSTYDIRLSIEEMMYSDYISDDIQHTYDKYLHLFARIAESGRSPAGYKLMLELNDDYHSQMIITETIQRITIPLVEYTPKPLIQLSHKVYATNPDYTQPVVLGWVECNMMITNSFFKGDHTEFLLKLSYTGSFRFDTFRTTRELLDVVKKIVDDHNYGYILDCISIYNEDIQLKVLY